MADVTPILIKDLAAQTTLQDTDYFIVGGADAKKITVAQMKSALGINELQEDVNELNTKINLINVESIERQGNANSMVSQSNSTAFYKINASSGTTANNFPVNSAGCLMVMNLYGIHVIQAYFAIGGSLHVRSIANAPEAGSSWTAWREK